MPYSMGSLALLTSIIQSKNIDWDKHSSLFCNEIYKKEKERKGRYLSVPYTMGKLLALIANIRVSKKYSL
jgi:hypothetical protein